MHGDDSRVLSLASQWRFRLDRRDIGRDQKWFERNLPDRIALPGTTDEAEFGTRTVGSKKGRLTRVHEYVGAAWYQRDVTIPESWHGNGYARDILTRAPNHPPDQLANLLHDAWLRTHPKSRRRWPH